ncbi:universal stress protein [Streptomyces sp. NBC_01619]|uniref:universal stress protein n=1 Tax=Streptomyces sp. NBC_01619 TaxID=2975901 RepID=UPI002259F671|nr:universal stress protein [Streptomyces sp. NBC_01619]MCX4510675.1 universal stress protein [Streptomyces sp. NBC_01619]
MTSNSAVLPVVFGVDAVQPADAALDWAADEAARRGAPLQLVHAVLPATHHVRGAEDTAHHKGLRRLGDEALDKATVRAHERHPELEVTAFVADGTPAKVLVRRSAHARLLVLGSRGLGRLAEALSTLSTTVPVSAHAACPVAVVPEAGRLVEEPPYLVVGLDGSPSAEAALDHALEAAAARGASVRAVWVWQRPLLGLCDEEAALEACRRHLHEVVDRRADVYRNVPLSQNVLRGHPVDALAAAAENSLAVVVGRRGREGFTGMRLGSVPHGLLHRASCSVITVPPPSGEEP